MIKLLHLPQLSHDQLIGIELPPSQPFCPTPLSFAVFNLSHKNKREMAD